MTVSHASQQLRDPDLTLCEELNRPVAGLFVAYNLSIIHLALALIFFPLTPIMVWIYFGQTSWAVSWLPEEIVLAILPAAHFLYWQYGGLLAGFAGGSCLLLFRRSRARQDLLLAALNLALGAAVLIARAILA